MQYRLLASFHLKQISEAGKVTKALYTRSTCDCGVNDVTQQSCRDTLSENRGGAFPGTSWRIRAAWKPNTFTSSQANFITSAFYFLIHLPHGEATFLLGGAFVENRDGSVVQRAMLWEGRETGDLIRFDWIMADSRSTTAPDGFLQVQHFQPSRSKLLKNKSYRVFLEQGDIERHPVFIERQILMV